LHLPEFFSPALIELRNVVYPALCAQARIVPVASNWTKRDVIEHFQLAEEKVRVVP